MTDVVRATLDDTRGQPAGERVQRVAAVGRRYAASYLGSLLHRDVASGLRTYCLFVGHARSGHSILGALLDAHREIVLPDEVDVLKYVAAGFGRGQILEILVEQSRAQARRGRAKQGRNTTYSYAVPGQWQGRYERVRVMGDSRAGQSTQRLERDPALLARLRATMGDVDVRILHVVRNPYDNISTLMIRGGRTFENAVDRYFANCRTLARLWEREPDGTILPVRHEDLILDTAATLRRCCEFLGVDAPEDYLQACAGILFAAPARSRDSVTWSVEQIELVRDRMAPFRFLDGYGFEV